PRTVGGAQVGANQARPIEIVQGNSVGVDQPAQTRDETQTDTEPGDRRAGEHDRGAVRVLELLHESGPQEDDDDELQGEGAAALVREHTRSSSTKAELKVS